MVIAPEQHGPAGAALGLIGIFVPGILFLLGILPFCDSFRRRPGAQAMMRAVNAAVVGLLAAALYNPVWTSSVKASSDFGIALVGFQPLFFGIGIVIHAIEIPRNESGAIKGFRVRCGRTSEDADQ
jgi:chromate transport protein ChrA